MAKNKIFIDSCAVIALFDARDQYHASAKNKFESLLPASRFFSSDYILDEVITFLNCRHDKSIAWEAGRSLYSSGVVEMIVIDKEDISKGVARFQRTSVKGVSFTDIMTCIVMDECGMDHVFTFDGHFHALGYIVV